MMVVSDRACAHRHAVQYGAQYNANEQRRVYLLGLERQRNGNDWRKKRPYGPDEIEIYNLFLCLFLGIHP